MDNRFDEPLAFKPMILPVERLLSQKSDSSSPLKSRNTSNLDLPFCLEQKYNEEEE